jgi:hypothetical protein
MVLGLKLNKNKLHLFFVLGIYFVFSFVMISEFRYVIDPDVTSYISIAQKYLHGDIIHAINGHWSPFVSWLGLPLLALNIRPIIDFELMAIVVGGITLVGIYLLMSEIEIGENLRFLFALSFVPLISLYALTEGNPDLLSLCILIFYLYLIIGDDFKTNRFRGLSVGFLAAMAYLAKSYNFYFFFLHFTCLVGLIWYTSAERSERRVVLINAFSGVLVFVLISSLWITLLSKKYHSLTLSTAGNYNFSYIRPGSPGHMVDTDGLLVPPNRTAYSAWEDPTYIPKVAWSPFNSAQDFVYFIKNTAKNAVSYLLFLSRNPLFFFTIIYFSLLLLPFRVKALADKPFYLFLTVALHPIGYLMLLIEDRYLWIDDILLYILTAYIVSTLFSRIDITRLKKAGVLAITCGYLAIMPLASMIYLINSDNYINHFRGIYFLSNKMANYQNFKNEKIASQVENWCDDLYLSYYLKARYYGKVKEGITDNQLRKELIDDKIDYYFVHGAPKNHLDILRPEGKFGDITVYKVLLPEPGKGHKVL